LEYTFLNYHKNRKNYKEFGFCAQTVQRYNAFSNILRNFGLQLKMTAESRLLYQENCHFMNIRPSVLELFYVRGRSNEYNAVCFGKELPIFKHRFFVLVSVGILKSRVSIPQSLYGGSLAIPLSSDFLVYLTFFHIHLHMIKENLK
jgi:hypothetical protein